MDFEEEKRRVAGSGDFAIEERWRMEGREKGDTGSYKYLPRMGQREREKRKEEGEEMGQGGRVEDAFALRAASHKRRLCRAWRGPLGGGGVEFPLRAADLEGGGAGIVFRRC